MRYRCGHERTPANTYTYPSTGRKCCLQCKREQARRWARKHAT